MSDILTKLEAAAELQRKATPGTLTRDTWHDEDDTRTNQRRSQTMAGIWRYGTDAPEGKYLVQRRDGTVPEWPYFVIGAKDPCALAALTAYADEAQKQGFDPDCVRDVRRMASEFHRFWVENGSGDPDGTRHRKDDPEVIQKMKGGGKRSMTPKQQNHLQLIRRIKGDPYWGRAVRECEACGGSGEVHAEGPHPKGIVCCPDCNGYGTTFREWLVCERCHGRDGEFINPSSGTLIGTCPDCKGEGRVPDEAGREVIAEAVREWAFGNGDWRVITKYCFDAESQSEEMFRVAQKLSRGVVVEQYRLWRYEPAGTAERLWKDRHGQPYQSALETHVRAYEQPPPDLLSLEGCEWLKGVLREKGWKRMTIDNLQSNSPHGCKLFQRWTVPEEWEWGDTEPAALLAACYAAWPEKGAKL